MSSTTIKRVETLKGVFSVPKVTYRRDFMRENKLKLRDIQRVALEKQESVEKKQKKEQQYLVRRRSASLQRTPSAQSSTDNNSNTQARAKYGSSHNLQKKSVNQIFDSKRVACDKQIQTEDIQDEEFLYNALKKCTTNSLYKEQIKSDDIQASNSEPYVCDGGEYNDFNTGYQEAAQLELQNSDMMDNINANTHMQNEHVKTPLGSARSRRSFLNGYEAQPSNATVNTMNLPAKNMHNYNDEISAPLSRQRSQSSVLNSNRSNYAKDEETYNAMSNLAISDKQKDEQPLSARSRLSVGTTKSQVSVLTAKKSNSSLYKQGSRDDVRLPRYLEREKREKEEERLRELNRDPDCPDGHIALSEHERLTALMGAEKKYNSLVAELNRLPMTTETLRIRNRKAKIEKELQNVENDIRLFSKNKVYVKQPD